MKYIRNLSNEIKRDWLTITTVFVVINLFFFILVKLLLKGGIGTIYSNWDAPSYVMVAISMYKPQLAYEHNILGSPLITPTWSFLPAHFPLYPALIRILSFIGMFRASLLISMVFSFLFLLAFYELVRKHKLSSNPLFLTLPLMLLTPRWFAIYHVGSTEPLFLFFTVLSLDNFLSGRHLYAAGSAALAQLTRPQGSLLGVAYAVIAIRELIITNDFVGVVSKYFYYLLIPLALLVVFAFYYLRTGDFFAFFSAIKVFGHGSKTLFPTFNYPAGNNIETFWQEVNVYDYILGVASILLLLKKKMVSLATFAAIFFVPLIFISHTDISRYALPLLPFLFIGFSEIIERREFVLASFIMSPAIMLYTINFMAFNHGA